MYMQWCLQLLQVEDVSRPSIPSTDVNVACPLYAQEPVVSGIMGSGSQHNDRAVQQARASLNGY